MPDSYWELIVNGSQSTIDSQSVELDLTSTTDPGGSFDLSALIITVVTTVVITLVFDWWIRPRLEVRTERFKMRAYDRITLIRTLGRMVRICAQLISADPDADGRLGEVVRERSRELRQELLNLTAGISEGHVALAAELPAPLNRVLSFSEGYVRGLCLSDKIDKDVGALAIEPIGVALDAISASKSTINYAYQMKKVREYVAEDLA